MDGDTRVVVDQKAIDALADSPEMVAALLDAGAPVVRDAKLRAPIRTGMGQLSIRAEPVLDGDEHTVHIAWDRNHYYMGFHEGGTISLPPRPFLVPSLEEVSQ